MQIDEQNQLEGGWFRCSTGHSSYGAEEQLTGAQHYTYFYFYFHWSASQMTNFIQGIYCRTNYLWLGSSTVSNLDQVYDLGDPVLLQKLFRMTSFMAQHLRKLEEKTCDACCSPDTREAYTVGISKIAYCCAGSQFHWKLNTSQI